MRHISDTINEWTERLSRKRAIHMLKEMLEWSQRLGRDEKDEIKNIIKILKNK